MKVHEKSVLFSEAKLNFNKTDDKIPTRLDYVKKEKLTDLPFIVLTHPFNYYMLI